MFVCIFYYNESETEIGGCPRDEGTPQPGLKKQNTYIGIFFYNFIFGPLHSKIMGSSPLQFYIDFVKL